MDHETLEYKPAEKPEDVGIAQLRMVGSVLKCLWLAGGAVAIFVLVILRISKEPPNYIDPVLNPDATRASYFLLVLVGLPWAATVVQILRLRLRNARVPREREGS